MILIIAMNLYHPPRAFYHLKKIFTEKRTKIRELTESDDTMTPINSSEDEKLSIKDSIPFKKMCF